jgi:hypothetical protein
MLFISLYKNLYTAGGYPGPEHWNAQNKVVLYSRDTSELIH